jgi:hypothetical protein
MVGALAMFGASVMVSGSVLRERLDQWRIERDKEKEIDRGSCPAPPRVIDHISFRKCNTV